MKKGLLLVGLTAILSAYSFADSPLTGWVWSDDELAIEHQGKQPIDWYRETIGRARDSEGNISEYWLYDTYTYAEGYFDYENYFFDYAEALNWTIAYDEYWKFDSIPDEVKALLKARNYDVAFQIIKVSNDYAMLVVYNWDKNKNVFWEEYYNMY